MVWEKFITSNSGLGTIVDVSIDYTSGLVKRKFDVNTITVEGKAHEYTEDQVQACFDRDVYWSNVLKSKFLIINFERTDFCFIINIYKFFPS